MEKLRRIIAKRSLNWLYSAIILSVATCLFVLLALNATAIKLTLNGFNKLASAPLQCYVLDVGQANANFVILPSGFTLLIDTGSEDSADTLTKQLDYIISKNKLQKEIDMVILTHSDADHVGGLAEILHKYEVYNIFRPKILAKSEADKHFEYNYNVVYTDAYDKAITAAYNEVNCDVQFAEDKEYQIKTASLQFYTCQDVSSDDTNYHSTMVVLEDCGKSFMFTGDATKKRETEFLQVLEKENKTCHIDFLVVAHHGSDTSSSEEFLNAITPSYALISAADSTHPSQKVVSRLQNAGVKDIFCTKTQGTIGVGLQENSDFKFYTCSFVVDVPLLGVVIYCICFVLIKLTGKRQKTNIIK